MEGSNRHIHLAYTIICAYHFVISQVLVNLDSVILGCHSVAVLVLALDGDSRKLRRPLAFRHHQLTEIQDVRGASVPYRTGLTARISTVRR